MELFRRVETVWADSAKKSPGLVRPWSNLCAARVKKSPLQAIADCDRALALAPREVMPLINKGVALMVMGEKEKAGQVFEDAVKRHPQSALARYNQGSWRANEGNLEAAISDYRAALKLDEFHRDSRLQLGILLIKTGKDREAAQELLLLTRLYPDFQPAFAWLGIASARSGDCQTARRAYDAALQTGPRTDEIYMLEELLRSCPR